MSKANRNSIFDAIKAFAILLVVYGHCIQYLSGVDFWNNRVFQVIYSFHMPLFFMVSGFFFQSATKLNFKEFLCKKALSLLLPCFVWAIIYGIISFDSWTIFFNHVVNPMAWPFWFLKGLFLTQLTVYSCIWMANKINRADKISYIWVAIVLSLMVYVLPFCAVPRIMVPMFWMGYLIRHYYEWFIKYHLVIGISALLLFIVCLHFWNVEYMHYSANAPVKLQDVVFGHHGRGPMDLLIVLYRILLGACGSISIIALAHSIKNVPSLISAVGSSTAGIYILQALLLEHLMGSYIAPYTLRMSTWPYWLVFMLILPVMAVLITLLCMWLRNLIVKSSILGLLLLGEVKKVTKELN